MNAILGTAAAPTIRLAVIGCGQWGQNHLRVFSSLPGCEVAMAVDVEADRLARLPQAHLPLRFEQDYRRALEDPSIDAVVIATPTGAHYPQARAALLAGKHVLCEKPLCQSAQEAAGLVNLSRVANCILMVGHVFLFNAGIVALKELIQRGELGALQYLFAVRTNLGPVRSDVNAAYDLASHDISIFNWILGAEPESVHATGGVFLQAGVEDVVTLTLRYPRNVLGIIHVSWLDPRKVRQITVVGNRRMATWDDLQPAMPLAIYDKGAGLQRPYESYGDFLKLSLWDGDVRLPKVQSCEPLKVQAEYFLEAVRTGKLDRSDGAFAVGVVKTLEAASRSLEGEHTMAAAR